MEGMDEDTDLTAARAQLDAGREEMESALSAASSMLHKAEKEIAKARKEFMEKRDEAYEDAGIDGIITVESQSNASLQEYRITNVLGQTVQMGDLTGRQIDIRNLTQGMYFITIGKKTQKIIVK
jgi:hypothetical protein